MSGAPPPVPIMQRGGYSVKSPVRHAKRVQTGFGSQFERWKLAVKSGDRKAMQDEFIRCFINCETPELFCDTVYTHQDWAAHHTWKRFLPEPLVWLRVLQCLSPVVLWVALVSTFVGIYATQLEPRGWPMLTNHSNFIAPFTLTSFALSLLLVFRTNSSYSRWWEARSAIGRMFNWPRIIVRLAIAFVPPEQEHIVRAMGRWSAVLTAATFAYILDDATYWRYAEDLLSPEELQWVRERDQPPFAALQVLSGLAKKASIDTFQRVEIERAINEFDLLVGAAERISRQCIPLAYTRHTSRFLMIFLSFLPWAYWPLFEWATIPICAMVTFMLVCLENIGIQIEEPYSVLPLHRFTVGVRRAVENTLANWQTAAVVVEEAAAQPHSSWKRTAEPQPKSAEVLRRSADPHRRSSEVCGGTVQQQQRQLWEEQQQESDDREQGSKWGGAGEQRAAMAAVGEAEQQDGWRSGGSPKVKWHPAVGAV